MQPFASLRPFHARFALFQGWEIPLPLRLLPPAFARRRSACMYNTPPPDLRAKASAKLKEEASMNTDAAAVSECCSFDRLLLRLSLFWQERYAYRWP